MTFLLELSIDSFFETGSVKSVLSGHSGKNFEKMIPSMNEWSEPT